MKEQNQFQIQRANNEEESLLQTYGRTKSSITNALAFAESAEIGIDPESIKALKNALQSDNQYALMDEKVLSHLDKIMGKMNETAQSLAKSNNSADQTKAQNIFDRVTHFENASSIGRGLFQSNSQMDTLKSVNQALGSWYARFENVMKAHYKGGTGSSHD
jgi:hypothetical protein